MKVFLNKFGFWIALVLCVLAYLALAFKNPFKDNNLISNLEPYPDTILYSFPAWNWVRGNGWNLGVSEKIVDISVPNTYGFLLAPLMWVFKDIRSFYFTNLIFGIGTLVFFMLALKNFVGKNKWYLIGLFGFLLATNFYFFNQPQLVMVENINYFLVGVFLYLLSIKFEWKHIWLMLLFLVFTLLLKSTNVVLGASFALSFLIKIIQSKKEWFNLKKILFLFSTLLVISLPLTIPRFLSLNLSSFSFGFFPKNFEFYYSCLTGGDCRNLWYWQKMVSWEILGLFVLGSLLMMRKNRERFLLIEIVLPLIILVLAMSLFIDTEGRHIEILIPILLVVGAFGLNWLSTKIKWPILLILIFGIIDLFFVGYQPNNFEMKIISLKKQVGLNFRHREDPWNYLCLKMVDDFMKDKKDSYFGSFLPIYFFDSYDVKVNYLPLSVDQDFMGGRGLKKYFAPPLKNIYIEKLREQKEVYLTDYYASNGRDAWRKEWNEIVSLGKLEKVWQSPLDNCNIYKLVESKK